jgi:hypothetical protein
MGIRSLSERALRMHELGREGLAAKLAETEKKLEAARKRSAKLAKENDDLHELVAHYREQLAIQKAAGGVH